MNRNVLILIAVVLGILLLIVKLSNPKKPEEKKENGSPCNCKDNAPSPTNNTPSNTSNTPAKSAKSFIESYNTRNWIDLNLDTVKGELLKSGYSTGDIVKIDF